MLGSRWIVILAPVLLFLTVVEVSVAKTLSRQEIESLWEKLLIEERYEALSFEDLKSSIPRVFKFKEKEMVVYEDREGYLWGLFGLSSGGGWRVEGRLESEVPIDAGLLQLYSKATSRWSPGLAFFFIGIISEPGYDPKKYPIWEFHLLLRNPSRRQEIHVLKSVDVPTEDVVLPNPVGQRTPQGELRYDAARKVVTIQILGVHHPFSVEVPLSQLSIRSQGKGE